MNSVCAPVSLAMKTFLKCGSDAVASIASDCKETTNFPGCANSKVPMFRQCLQNGVRNESD
jgi:hypothetical protein